MRAQVFNFDGSKSGSEFLVNTTTLNAQSQPCIATLNDGRFVISFVDDSHSADDSASTAIRSTAVQSGRHQVRRGVPHEYRHDRGRPVRACDCDPRRRSHRRRVDRTRARVAATHRARPCARRSSTRAKARCTSPEWGSTTTSSAPASTTRSSAEPASIASKARAGTTRSMAAWAPTSCSAMPATTRISSISPGDTVFEHVE